MFKSTKIEIVGPNEIGNLWYVMHITEHRFLGYTYRDTIGFADASNLEGIYYDTKTKEPVPEAVQNAILDKVWSE